MHALFIDLASHHGTLACVTEKAVGSFRPIDHRIGDAELLPELDACLKEAGWKEKDLTHVACVTGPGGFTSLRVAAALANTLAHALRIPAAGIHLSDLYRARTAESDIVWLHSTKAKEIFARGFGAHAALWPEAADTPLDALLENIPTGANVTGELLETHRALLEAKKVKIVQTRELRETLPAFLAKLPFAPGILQPWYGREG